MSEPKEELGVIGKVDFGCRDIGRPCLWFEIKLLRGCVVKAFTDQHVLDFVREAGVFSISELEGRACVVKMQGDMLVGFERLK